MVDEPNLEKIIRFLGLERIKNYSTKNLKDTLSKGEQQKVQLARLLLNKYPIILLDECFSALDELNKIKVISELKKKSDNSIIIIISHDPEIIKRCGKTLFLLEKNYEWGKLSKFMLYWLVYVT